MPSNIHFKMAESSEEMDALFCTRYKVFVEQERYMPERNDRRIYDYFDALPVTKTLLRCMASRL